MDTQTRQKIIDCELGREVIEHTEVTTEGLKVTFWYDYTQHEEGTFDHEEHLYYSVSPVCLAIDTDGLYNEEWLATIEDDTRVMHVSLDVDSLADPMVRAAVAERMHDNNLGERVER